MKKCRYCKQEVESNAEICPHCGKNQTRPIFKVLGVFLLILFCLTIVMGRNSSKRDKEDLSTKSADTMVVSPTKAKDNTTNNDSVKPATANESTEPQPTQEEPQSNEVVYDANGIKITYTGIEDSILGKKVKFLIENNSEKSYTVQERDLSVNGFVVDASMSADVPAGKKANDGITIYESSLEENGITDIENIEFYFHVFNSNEWLDDFDSAIITLAK